MKKIVTTLCAVAALALVANAAFAANAVRISQVYGGGGGGTGTYLNDFVELFNSSGSPVNIGGWSIEYGSSTGTSFGSSSTNYYNLPAGTIIQPCSYLLVQTGAAGTAGVAIPSPDLVTTNISMSATQGKVALVSQLGANLPCAGNSVGGVYVDVVGYGSATVCYETAVAPTTTSTQSVIRGNGGLADTDNNANDFSLSLTVVPRNSHTAPNATCVITPSMNSTWGRVKSIYR
jgi:hypothetical protein